MSAFTIFSDLIASYPTWSELRTFLTSASGGLLRVDYSSTSDNPFALIRYVKDKSDFTLSHVKAFRSVVWDVLENRPVSITPFKSVSGETYPSTAYDATTYTLEHFVDGVMIGYFYDKYNSKWRIHTRSTLDAQCRYYSQTTTFASMFETAWKHASASATTTTTFDPSHSYTFVLQHPENRIVVPISQPRLFGVQNVHILPDGRFTMETKYPFSVSSVSGVSSWDDVRRLVSDWNKRFRYTIQGVVIKDTTTGERYKIRTAEYNRVRAIRGNTSRRDYIWMSRWTMGQLPEYLEIYPEEKQLAMAIVGRWKQATSDVFHIYTDVFKARTLEKSSIPPKYRPLIYGIHTMYMETLKPTQKKVDWKTVVQYMNERDVPQMLYILNWELRLAAKQLNLKTIPFEPSVSATTVPETDV